MLTGKKYLLIISMWLKNIVQDVKLFLISFQSRILDILIYVDRVTLKKLENIALLLEVNRKQQRLGRSIIKITKKRYMHGMRLDIILNVLTLVRAVIKKSQLMVITKTTLNHWKLFGCVDNATLLYIGKIG